MLASVHTAIRGWDLAAGLAVVLVAWLLGKLVPEVPWVPLATLFAASLLVFVIAVKW